MPRIRTVKPELFLNEDLATLPLEARLLFIGLFTQADRRGRMEDRPKRLKAALFPYDDINVDDCLSALHNSGFVIRYEVDGVRLIQVKNFERHQRFSGDEARAESKYPEYQHIAEQESTKQHASSIYADAEKPGKERKGREGNGDKHQQQQACVRGQIEQALSGHRPRLEQLFPGVDLDVAAEKLIAHCRDRPILDPYERLLKWLQGEFVPRGAVVHHRDAPGGERERILEHNRLECRAFAGG